MVPRPAGSTIVFFAWVCAIAARDEARTVWIHAARAPRPANVRRMTRRRRRSRELTTRVFTALPAGREVEIGRVAPRGLDQAESACGRLDPRRRVVRRERGGEHLVPSFELPALVLEPR